MTNTDLAPCPFCGMNVTVHSIGFVWHDGYSSTCAYQAPSAEAHNKLAREAEMGREIMRIADKYVNLDGCHDLVLNTRKYTTSKQMKNGATP